jgi:hypothetical protein
MKKRQISKNWAKRATGGSSKEQIDARVQIHDGFHTPIIALQTLLQKEDVAHHVWEPSAGFFRIVKPLRKRGFKVFTSDICDWHDDIQQIKDFTLYKQPPKCLRNKTFDILTNPPFRLAQQFVEKSMELLPKNGRLYLLLRLQFLEGIKRNPLFKKYPPYKIWIYSFRLPRMRRFLYKGKNSGSLLCFAWFCWYKGYSGSTTIDWIGRD